MKIIFTYAQLIKLCEHHARGIKARRMCYSLIAVMRQHSMIERVNNVWPLTYKFTPRALRMLKANKHSKLAPCKPYMMHPNHMAYKQPIRAS